MCLHGDGVGQFECAPLFGVGGGEQVEGNGTVILGRSRSSNVRRRNEFVAM